MLWGMSSRTSREQGPITHPRTFRQFLLGSRPRQVATGLTVGALATVGGLVLRTPVGEEDRLTDFPGGAAFEDPAGLTRTDQTELDLVPGTKVDEQFLGGDAAISWDAANAPKDARRPDGGVVSAVSLRFEDGAYEARAVTVRPKEGADRVPALVSVTGFRRSASSQSTWFGDEGASTSVPERTFDVRLGGQQYTVSMYRTRRVAIDAGQAVLGDLETSEDGSGRPTTDMQTDQVVKSRGRKAPKVMGFPALQI